jgi:DNA polymerase III subunits gamma and tau domain III
VTKVAPDAQGLLDRSPAAVASLQTLASRASVAELQTLFELLTTTEMRVRDSAQPIWMLEMSLLKLASLPALQSLSALVTRLESLERRLGGISGGNPADVPAIADRVREDETIVEASSATARPQISGSPPSSAPFSAVEAPISPADLVRKIIEGASTRALGWILEQHCHVQMTDTALEVTFQGNHRMAHELLHEDETLRTLQQIAHTAAGRDIAIRIIDAPAPHGKGAHTSISDAPVEENLMALTRAAIVRDTVELFGGRILDVRQRSVGRDARERPLSEDEMVSREDVDDDE